jgi:membrane fusion protein (multidrug efflux system)
MARPRDPNPHEAGETGETHASDAPQAAQHEGAPHPPVRERLESFFRGHPARIAALVGSLFAATVCGFLWWHHARAHESTDDAQIDGDISSISPRVTGTVASVHVVDNQRVRAGDLLVELDPADYQAALAQARANVDQAEAFLRAEHPNVPITETTNAAAITTSTTDLDSARASLASAERQYAQARAQLNQAEASDRYAQVERARFARLVRTDAVSRSEYDQRASAADVSSASVVALRAAVEAARRRIDEEHARVVAAQAKLAETSLNAPRQLESRQATFATRVANLEAARAQLTQAELNLEYTHVRAPVDGIVGRKAVNVGDRVQPGQLLLAITQVDHVWVTANFRETQLANMRPGQPVAVHVDALGVDLRGAVESMPGATGARYSLLPPENATGNYVKVVQRLPVRIRLERGQSVLSRLRPGMSVEPTVTVR